MSFVDRTQSGSALIISLVMLVILTLLGVSGVQNTTLEIRMAANTEDRNRAFQSAEYTLKIAEAYVADLVNTGKYIDAFGNIPGLYKTLVTSTSQGGGKNSSSGDCSTDVPWLSSKAKWDSTDSIALSSVQQQALSTLNLDATPRYMIGYDNDYDESSPCFSDISPEGYSNSIGSAGEPLRVERFTITVIGYGAQTNTRVRLQATYNVLL